MTPKRPARTGPPLLAITRADIGPGGVLDSHRHAEHMIAWAATATATLRTGARDWLVPPTHALWVPAGTDHAVEMLRPGDFCAVVLDPARCPIDWPEPTGVRITPLVRELIRHLDANPHRDDAGRQAESLLLTLLEPVPTTTFQVPLPEDPRLRVIADALIADPGSDRDLAAWAHFANASVRTVSRLFAAETGMTFAQWRTRVRIRAALTHLARGASVGATARAVGYRKPSAFAATFHRLTGQHPGVYSR
ncbi:helix-turn-helix transcriptional regulator [Nocardia seriolae]|uniref:HTH-type transcriptional regulator RipA n=1 Tax=Nocardia seriolae TaxID=37332 RepID=A0A0B8N1M8_9NOCA|nr:AraC family transcriptional regulator [Nocardia seriolae]APB00194.1 HTH-type transcriptional regulator RipA [Nocardia seriolae]MTJ64871.1 helix-turn-helix domain-containing protein [Nocardia seriolae]MTJ70896.1 helix-turn-helix domain-containing protein [Nocardia seriolae]MTJ89687.1 helix-turn-helix domain-containing protein [Nocardia seriolae]MTK33662.1 helix-turn-helix domain-containing protein [Nocardia seriolae]